MEWENFFYPTDVFPFTGETGSLMANAEAHHVRPKMFHIITGSEYFNRAGSLIEADVTGTHDVPLPPDSRIYQVASSAHGSWRRCSPQRCAAS